MPKKFAVAIALLLIGAASVEVGFGLGLGSSAQVGGNLLHGPGILVWSFFVGNGFIWLSIHAAIQMALLRNVSRIVLFAAQAVASIALGVTMARGWHLLPAAELVGRVSGFIA